MIDIINEVEEKVVPKWAKFTNDGDNAQGTYIGKIVGQKDGYGNEQIIYQLLQDDNEIINVGFGLNKKVLHKDMGTVKFGQIIGFKYKGTISVKDKRRPGNMVDVKDFSLHEDPKIVNDVWLKEHKDNMPEVTVVTDNPTTGNAEASVDALVDELKPEEDVPFSSEGSTTNEDKLVVITKIATEKLGATDTQSVKDKVMEKTSIAFIPVNFDKIIEALTT